MKARKQSTTSYPILFLMVDSTDHVTGKAGLTPTVTISKNGGAFASPSGAVTELSSGWYALAGNATDRNTVGELLIHATGTGADPLDDRYLVVGYDPFDVPTALLDLADAVDTGLTVRHALELAAASVLQKLSGAGTGTEVVRNFSDTADLATVTVSAVGNKTAITYDFSI